jgi:hypothetical protein
MELRLAKRSLGVPQLVHWLTVLSFLTLDIAKDVTKADHFAVNVQCAILPDIRTMFSIGGARTGLLNFLDCVAVPIDDAPARTQSVGCANRGHPVLLLYFTTPEDSTGGDGSVSVAYPLSQDIMDYMASAPTETVRSALLGDAIVPLVNDNMEALLE